MTAGRPKNGCRTSSKASWSKKTLTSINATGFACNGDVGNRNTAAVRAPPPRISRWASLPCPAVARMLAQALAGSYNMVLPARATRRPYSARLSDKKMARRHSGRKIIGKRRGASRMTPAQSESNEGVRSSNALLVKKSSSSERKCGQANSSPLPTAAAKEFGNLKPCVRLSNRTAPITTWPRMRS